MSIGLGRLHGLGVGSTQAIRVVLGTIHVAESLTLHLLLRLLLDIELLGTALTLLGCLS